MLNRKIGFLSLLCHWSKYTKKEDPVSNADEVKKHSGFAQHDTHQGAERDHEFAQRLCIMIPEDTVARARTTTELRHVVLNEGESHTGLPLVREPHNLHIPLTVRPVDAVGDLDDTVEHTGVEDVLGHR